MSIKLLDIIKRNKISKEEITAIYNCLNDRLFWLEGREPESDGIVYETWEEKYDEWNDIIDFVNEFMSKDNCSEDKMLMFMDKLGDMVDDYQLMYGGLSRLKVEL